MSTVRLDITEKKTKEEIESFLKKKKLKEGDTLKILKNKDTSDLELMAALMLVAIALIFFYRKKGSNNQIPVTDSIDSLERFAENETGLKIDIEPKPNASYDSNNDYEFSPRVKSLLGSMKVAEDQADYKRLLEDEILKKHLK